MVFFRYVVGGAILLIMLVMATAGHAQSPYDDVLVAQGLRNLQAENYDEALANFKTAWEKGTKTSAKAYYLGMTNYRLTNYSEAIHYLERAIYLDPANNEARLQLAAVYLALDRPAEALPYLQELEAAGYKPAVTAMYLGQVAAQQGQAKQAVKYYGQAAENPLLAQQAKIQTSLALTKGEKYSDAQRALQEAISLNPTSREAGFAQRYSDAINRRLDEIRPFHARLGASFDYDSNVTLTPSAAGAANVLVAGGRDAVFTQFGNLEYEFFPTGSYGLMASYNLFMTWHPRLTLYDVMSHTFGITPAYRFSQGTLWLPVRFNYTDLDSNKYWTSYSLIPTYLHMVTPNLGVETTLRLIRNYYWWLQPFPQEDRSSQNIGGSLGAYYFFKKQQGYVQARAQYEYYGASGSNWTSSIYSLLFSALYPVTDKLRLNPSMEFVLQPFDHPWFNGVDYQAKRRDKIMILGLQVLYKIYKNLDVNLHYYYIRDDSNTPLYDYDRTIAGLMFEYRY
jgi:tetratricopeptide (TPR) repeat protein